jgi:glycosyltransferase involved in cell wall biosynthesis
MTIIKKPYLLETMLLGSSISALEKVGSANREVEYYNLLSDYFDTIIFDYDKSIAGDSGRMSAIFGNKWLNSIFGAMLRCIALSGTGVIRSKQLWGSWSGWIFARLRGKKFIIRCGYIWSRSVLQERQNLPRVVILFLIMVEKILIRRADALIFAGEDIANFYSRLIDVPFVVIPNGFNISNFRSMSVARDYDFVYTGRLIALKGIDRMMRVIGPQRTLLVVGCGPLAAGLERHNNVRLIGVVPNNDLPTLLNRARFFISMSLTEGCPKCLIEGVLCGLYPIVSDIPAHRNIVQALGYGLLLADDATLEEEQLVLLKIDTVRLESFRRLHCMTVVVRREAEFCASFVC